MNIRRLLVPTDFGPCSQAAMLKACHLAEASGAELHLVHVAGELDDDGRRRLMEKLHRAVEPHFELALTVRRQVLHGSPAGEVVEYGRQHDVDLIVMGTHGRVGLAHWAVGSVTERVIRLAGCSVLVVKPADAEQNQELSQAARILHDAFGSRMDGKRNEIQAQLIGRLSRELGVSEVRAEAQLQQLEGLGVLAWSKPAADSSPPAGEQLQINPAALRPDVPGGSTRLVVHGEPAPAIDLLQRAVASRATDVHIDPADDDQWVVRFRIDGNIERYCLLDHDVALHLLHQFKLSADLDIADPFHAQEGRMRLPQFLTDLEVRVTAAPVAGGPAVSLRIFDRDRESYSLGDVGLTAVSMEAVQRMLQNLEGLVLVTGPTGSGKTTTVYSMLRILGEGKRNLVSIEDPLEHAVPFMRQMAVDERHDVSMLSGLRTILRMDPDIVFVGEIRDSETAEIAMRAAGAGRCVFSTLHTRDVAATVTALRDLRVDNRSLAANLTGVINQRLVRRLCPKCSQRVPITASQRDGFIGLQIEPPDHLHQSAGCSACRGTGFLGRVGVFESAFVDDSISQAIVAGAAETELRTLIRSAGNPSLTADALSKVRDGWTSYDEAMMLRWL